METMIEKNKELCEKYPFLIPYNEWTGKLDEDWNYEYTWLDDMPTGWRIAFGEQMCEEISAALNLLSEEDKKDYRIEQIKEKFGELRWYSNWTTEEIEKVIDKYTYLSARTCVKCGKPAEYISKGWICPWCRDCAASLSQSATFIQIDDFFSKT